MTEHRRRYKKPPIEEALCEFHFNPSQEWDLTIPGRLHAKLEHSYPAKPRQQSFAKIGLRVEDGVPADIQFGQGVEKVQLLTQDERRIVGVGADVLSVHMLRPYQDPCYPEGSGWAEFQERISTALDAYWSVSRPVGVRKVGMRYINRIEVPQSPIRVGDYLRCALPEVDGLPDSVAGFAGRIEYRYGDGVRLVLSQALAGASPDHVAFLLDLDVIWNAGEPLNKDDALLKAVDLRRRERAAFETVITDKARELFNAD